MEDRPIYTQKVIYLTSGLFIHKGLIIQQDRLYKRGREQSSEQHKTNGNNRGCKENMARKGKLGKNIY